MRGKLVLFSLFLLALMSACLKPQITSIVKSGPQLTPETIETSRLVASDTLVARGFSIAVYSDKEVISNWKEMQLDRGERNSTWYRWRIIVTFDNQVEVKGECVQMLDRWRQQGDLAWEMCSDRMVIDYVDDLVVNVYDVVVESIDPDHKYSY